MHLSVEKSARSKAGYYLTNFEQKQEKQYQTAILLSGKKLEIHPFPIPTGLGSNPDYKSSWASDCYSLFNPAGYEDMTEFWVIFRGLEE